MLRAFKRLAIAGLAALMLAVPLALTSKSASAAGWHGYAYPRYYHHRYHPYYHGYWPHAYHYGYYAYGPPPLLGALAAVALLPVALLAPRYYYVGPPYYYGPGPFW